MLLYNDTDGRWFYGEEKYCLWTIVSPINSTIQVDLIDVNIDCDGGANLRVLHVRIKMILINYILLAKCKFRYKFAITSQKFIILF